ncbi:hypothetical protein MZC50_09055 [Yersinia pestis subsp. pestis]|uniref:hypothetical protein n=1 Tax=Yersinia pestis TaxID=632 RepID=UPI0021F387C6|nr:hypothetical protein [Yersinia pestis]MCV6862044.1 hypothetical protein [Yersinia pestis subsp. pestis]
MRFKPGFIAPPWPHITGDSVSAESLIQRIEKEAHHGCGLHYEIYQYHVLCELRSLLTSLSAGDAETFTQAAAKRGFHLDDKALKESRQCYHETLAEIRQNQE